MFVISISYLDSSTINHNAWSIESPHSHNCTWHLRSHRAQIQLVKAEQLYAQNSLYVTHSADKHLSQVRSNSDHFTQIWQIFFLESNHLEDLVSKNLVDKKCKITENTILKSFVYLKLEHNSKNLYYG